MEIYLKEGAPGMDINDEMVIKYLDQEFSKEVVLNPLFVFFIK